MHKIVVSIIVIIVTLIFVITKLEMFGLFRSTRKAMRIQKNDARCSMSPSARGSSNSSGRIATRLLIFRTTSLFVSIVT